MRAASAIMLALPFVLIGTAAAQIPTVKPAQPIQPAQPPQPFQPFEPAIGFQGRALRFSSSEKPYYQGRIAMVPLNAVCKTLDAGITRSRDSRAFLVVRGRDRLNCSLGDSTYMFNGVRKFVSAPPEVHGTVVFVPFELIQSISCGELDVKTDLGQGPAVTISFGDKLVRFGREDAPFRRLGAVYVSLRPTASVIGARLDRSKDNIHWVITRSRDRVQFDMDQRWFSFNGLQRGLPGEPMVKGRSLYVPIEIFQALVGDEIRCK